jgi:hypothetical protein
LHLALPQLLPSHFLAPASSINFEKTTRNQTQWKQLSARKVKFFTRQDRWFSQPQNKTNQRKTQPLTKTGMSTLPSLDLRRNSTLIDREVVIGRHPQVLFLK